MKKIIISLMLGSSLLGTAFAQSNAQYYVQRCESSGGTVQCLIGQNAPAGGTPVMNQYTATPAPTNTITSNLSSFATPALTGAAAQQAAAQVSQGQQPKAGKFTNVPGGNVFVFCSGGRPGKYSPWRPVYDSICPAGKIENQTP